MPIPDWVARETRYLDALCFIVAGAMFTDGELRRLEDGSEVMVLREEWPFEVGAIKKMEKTKAIWRVLMVRGLVSYIPEDHMATSGWKRGSYVISCQDQISKFRSVSNRIIPNLERSEFPVPLPDPVFESEARRLTRARANNITPDAPAATHQHHQQPQQQQHQPPPTATTGPQQAEPGPRELPTLEEALELVGFNEIGQASDLLTSFGANSIAVALRTLVGAQRRAAKGLQGPVGSRTKFVMFQLRMGLGKTYAEVEDFSFLGHFVGWDPPADPRVLVFPGGAERED